MAIDKLDIAAMRKADRICFRTDDGVATIECIKDARKSAANPFAEEIQHNIFVAYRFVDYARMSSRLSENGDHELGRLNHEKTRAFEYLASAQYCDIWQTIAGLLRVGDELTLVWQIAGQSTQGLAAAGFRADSLLLEIMRGDKKLVFRIATGIASGESSFPMVRDRRDSVESE